MPTSPRLKIPSPKARVARSLFEKDLNFADGTPDSNKVSFVPIPQWGAYRIRVLTVGAALTLNIAYVRPARQTGTVGQQASIPAIPEYEYTTGQPVVATLAVADGVEGILDVLADEHLGENWLRVELDPAGASDLTFCDISGVLLGLGAG